MWYVWFDKTKGVYQLTNVEPPKWLAAFPIFDMAYDYVTTKNRITDCPAYSRWTVGR